MLYGTQVRRSPEQASSAGALPKPLESALDPKQIAKMLTSGNSEERLQGVRLLGNNPDALKFVALESIYKDAALAAVGALRENHSALVEVAKGSKQKEVVVASVGLLGNNASALVQLAKSETPNVPLLAVERLRGMVNGLEDEVSLLVVYSWSREKEEGRLAMEKLASKIDEIEDPCILEIIARECPDAGHRLAAVEKLSGNHAKLMDIAKSLTYPDSGIAALNKLSGSFDALSHIATYSINLELRAAAIEMLAKNPDWVASRIFSKEYSQLANKAMEALASSPEHLLEIAIHSGAHLPNHSLQLTALEMLAKDIERVKQIAIRSPCYDVQCRALRMLEGDREFLLWLVLHVSIPINRAFGPFESDQDALEHIASEILTGKNRLDSEHCLSEIECDWVKEKAWDLLSKLKKKNSIFERDFSLLMMQGRN